MATLPCSDAVGPATSQRLLRLAHYHRFDMTVCVKDVIRAKVTALGSRRGVTEIVLSVGCALVSV